MSLGRILVIEDHRRTLLALVHALGGHGLGAGRRRADAAGAGPGAGRVGGEAGTAGAGVESKLGVRGLATPADLGATLAREQFDALVLDLDVADLGGEAVLRTALQCAPQTPVIAVSAQRDQSIVIRCLRAGVADFLPLSEALTAGVLRRAVDEALRAARQRQADRRRSARREQSLHRLAETDALTGLANRRHVDRLLAAGRWRHERRRCLSALMIDLDHFKRVNDRFGHAAGDAVLRAVAAELKAECAAGDTLVRWGGEEFLLVHAGAGPADGWVLAQRLRARLAALDLRFAGERVAISASIGLAEAGPDGVDEHALERADHALYAAKDRGRDRACTWRLVEAEQRCEQAALGGAGDDPDAGPAAALARLLAPRGLAGQGLDEAHRSELCRHSGRTARLAGQMARRLGWPEPLVAGAHRVGLLHDLGKLAAPPQVLAKPAGLTPAERLMLADHLRETAALAACLGAGDEDCAALTLVHRGADESTDGQPLAVASVARLVSIADALASMLSVRPYRAALGGREAIEALRRERGARLDAALIDRLLPAARRAWRFEPADADRPAPAPAHAASACEAKPGLRAA